MLQEGKRGAPPRCDSNLIGAILSHSGAIALRGETQAREARCAAAGLAGVPAGCAHLARGLPAPRSRSQGGQSGCRAAEAPGSFVSVLADGLTSLRQTYT